MGPNEIGEARCEAWAIDNIRGDEFKCCCGNWVKLGEGETLSPDPYEIPVCGECFDTAMTERYGDRWKEQM